VIVVVVADEVVVHMRHAQVLELLQDRPAQRIRHPRLPLVDHRHLTQRGDDDRTVTLAHVEMDDLQTAVRSHRTSRRDRYGANSEGEGDGDGETRRA
jgi:hypothetical protein